MKITLLRQPAAVRASLLFLVLSSAWILFIYYVLKHDLTSEFSLVVGMTILSFFYIKGLAKQKIRMRERHKGLFDTHPGPMWIYDKESVVFLIANVHAYSHYSYTKEEFIAMTILNRRPPQNIEVIQQLSADLASRSERVPAYTLVEIMDKHPRMS